MYPIENNLFFILASSQLFPGIKSFNPHHNIDQRNVNNKTFDLIRKGLSFFEEGHIEAAIKVYTEAIEKHPDQPFFYACRAMLASHCGDEEGEYYDYQIAKRLDFNYHHLLESLEFEDEMVESYELMELNDMIEQDSKNIQLYVNRALVLVQHFLNRRAIQDYTTALSLHFDPKILISKAAVHMRIVEYNIALQDLDLAIETDNSLTDAYLHRGKLFDSIHEYDLAEQDFNICIDREPTNAGYYEERAKHFEQIKDFRRAIADYSILIQLTPEDFFVYILRAEQYEHITDYQAALHDYNEAIRLNPYYSDLYQYRGDVKEKMGDKLGAKLDFEKFFELETEDDISS